MILDQSGFKCRWIYYLLNIAGYLINLFWVGLKRGERIEWKSAVENWGKILSESHVWERELKRSYQKLKTGCNKMLKWKPYGHLIHREVPNADALFKEVAKKLIIKHLDSLSTLEVRKQGRKSKDQEKLCNVEFWNKLLVCYKSHHALQRRWGGGPFYVTQT